MGVNARGQNISDRSNECRGCRRGGLSLRCGAGRGMDTHAALAGFFQGDATSATAFGADTSHFVSATALVHAPTAGASGLFSYLSRWLSWCGVVGVVVVFVTSNGGPWWAIICPSRHQHSPPLWLNLPQTRPALRRALVYVSIFPEQYDAGSRNTSWLARGEKPALYSCLFVCLPPHIQATQPAHLTAALLTPTHNTHYTGATGVTQRPRYHVRHEPDRTRHDLVADGGRSRSKAMGPLYHHPWLPQQHKQQQQQQQQQQLKRQPYQSAAIQNSHAGAAPATPPSLSCL